MVWVAEENACVSECIHTCIRSVHLVLHVYIYVNEHVILACICI